MLDSFRRMIRSKVGAVVALLFLGLIALAFASADVANTGGFGAGSASDRVATVGSERVDASTLSQAATSSLEGMKQQNPTMSMQAFLAAGGLERVLDDLVARTAVAVFGKDNGIVASDRLIDSEIAKIQAFKGPDGQFSEAAFRQVIQQRGMSEAMVRSDLAQGLIARQVLLPAGLGATLPRELAVRYAGLLRERRKGAIAVLPSEAFAPTAAPSDAVLTKYYSANSSRFIRPERRVIRYASFGDEALKTVPAPTEAEITERYKANSALYAALESRKITQLIVPTEAAAKAVVAEVAGGRTLEAAASAKGLTAAEIGTVAREALAGQSSKAVADAVFAAARGAIAAPARSGLGWHVIRVDGIEQRAGKSLEQARGELVSQLNVLKRRAALSDLSARIEEEFDAGGSLADAAKNLGLTISQTPAITADGAAYANRAERAPPILARVLQTAFSMENENEPQLAEVDPGKTFVIYDVSDIAASAPAPLAEIREDVIGAWKLSQGFAAAKAAADTVQAAVKKGTTLQAAMAALGRQLPPAQTLDVGREDLAQMGQQVPPSLTLMFSMAERTVKVLPIAADRGLYVVQLADIAPAPIKADDPVVAAVQRELSELSGNELAEQLRRAITKQVGVERNAPAIKAVRTQLTGGN